MTALNPITALRLKRAKARRAPMPVSQKPRRKKGESSGPCTYSVAGTLLYSFYEAGMRRKAQQVLSPEALMERSERRGRGRRVRSRIHVALLGLASKRGAHAAPGEVYYAPADVAGSRPAERRRRQGAHLHQHPSVVARFANHPTRAQIEAAAARIEQLDPLRKIEGETKQQRDARIKRERRQATAA